MSAQRNADGGRVRPPRRAWWWRAPGLLALFAMALVGGGVHWLSTQSALDALMARAVARSEGRLSIDGATGSLLSTVKIDRLRWEGDEVSLEATGVALTWSPTDLLSRRFNVRGFGAQRLTVGLKPSGGEAVLPASLALPLEVAIAQAGIGRIEWSSGARRGVLTGLRFAYAGGAERHRISGLALVTEHGTLSGALDVDARPPFAVAGKMAFRGGNEGQDTAEGTVSGTLEALDFAASIALHGAHGTGTARIAPFSALPVVAWKLALADVDLQRFAPALPVTRLDVALTAEPRGTAMSGTLEVNNADSGPLDANRIPARSLTTRFAWLPGAIELTELSAVVAGTGTVTGSARYDFERGGARFDLGLRGVDLRQVHGALIATALGGTLAGDLAGEKRTLRGRLSQADMQFAFDASLVGRVIEVDGFRASAGSSELAASGRVSLDGTRAFSINGMTRALDPARFGAFPAGALSTTFAATGALAPTWTAAGNISIAPGSRIAGVSMAGSARGEFGARQLRNADASLDIATGKVKVSGSAGARGDTLAFALDFPDVAVLSPLLTALAGGPAPEKIRGALRANGSVSVQPEGGGFEIEAHGGNLEYGTAYGAVAIDVRAALPPTGSAVAAYGLRSVALAVSASGVRAPQGAIAAARIDVSGTLARHTVAVALSGDGVDAHALATGGFHGAGASSPDRIPWPWTGRIDALTNRGALPVLLAAPAVLEASHRRVHLADAHLGIAEGAADIDEFVWDDGRITSRGRYAGVPVAALARLSGHALPIGSTLTIKGGWSVAATPRLDGTIELMRDAGDLYGADAGVVDPARALGITTLSASAQFVADALTAKGVLRSARAGNADATLAMGTRPGAGPGRISTDAPLNAKLAADIATLRPLQTWLGTIAAIDGRAHVDLAVGGTLADPITTGAITADDLRVSLPQHGVLITDGQIRSHLADGRLLLDELSLTAGDGNFTAKGTLAATPTSGVTPGVTWRAEGFRIVNLPDLRLVIAGEGSLAVDAGRLLLAGDVRIIDGRIIYQRVTEGRLADDVVVVGWEPRTNTGFGSGLGERRLRLDLNVDMASGVAFSGEGLDARLAGRVHLASLADGTLNATGTINASNGTYVALGQKLTIERGTLTFDGPVDNPALDVVALRKNLAVEAGFQLTGTVRVPRVRLISNPPVPENEILSWLVSGQPLNRASRADSVALASASAALLGGGRRPITQTLASTLGVDDVSVHESSVAKATGQTSGQVIALGKRVTDRLSIVYEQGLTIATNALRVEYELTRNLTLRASAGAVGSAGIYYSRSFE